MYGRKEIVSGVSNVGGLGIDRSNHTSRAFVFHRDSYRYLSGFSSPYFFPFFLLLLLYFFLLSRAILAIPTGPVFAVSLDT